MRDANRSEDPLKLEGLAPAETWRRLTFEQRAAAVGSNLLIVSTIGPFSFVEVAVIVVAAAVLLLLRKRAEGREFHIPFGDGTMIAVAGVWAGVLILLRLFDRPVGQGLLALVCAAILVLAGLRERAKRPMDDLPTEKLPDRPGGSASPKAPPPPR